MLVPGYREYSDLPSTIAMVSQSVGIQMCVGGGAYIITDWAAAAYERSGESRVWEADAHRAGGRFAGLK